MQSTDELHDNQPSIFGSTLRFKGELRADEDVVIRGSVDGSITHSTHLTIGREGRVNADIHGQIVAVEGKVDGDITAAVSVAVLAGASVTGDIRAPSISIVDGAAFNGGVVMGAGTSPQIGAPPRGQQARNIVPGINQRNNR